MGREEDNYRVLGKKSVRVKNGNSENLIEFASRNNLKIANTFFLMKQKLKWTWISLDAGTKNEIERVMLINDMRIVNNL